MSAAPGRPGERRGDRRPVVAELLAAVTAPARDQHEVAGTVARHDHVWRIRQHEVTKPGEGFFHVSPTPVAAP